MKPIRRLLLAFILSMLCISKLLPCGSIFFLSDSFRFECTIKNGTENVRGMVITVFLDEKKVIQKTSNRQGNFFLYLKHNKIYTIELSKRDFINEKIIIDTKISDKLLNDKGIETAIDNEFPVFEYYPGVKTDIFNQPIICYIYNENLGYFEQDKKRSKQMNTVISQISSIKNKLAGIEAKTANSLFTQKNYVDALIAYNKVIELSPLNAQALPRIKEINKLLKNEAAKTFEKYKELIGTADKLFAENNFNDSKNNYKQAAALMPENPYAKSQITLIDSLITKLYVENKGSYDKIKYNADNANKEKKYVDALNLYQEALKILPGEIYPIQQIAAIKSVIELEKKKKDQEQKVIDEQFNGLIKKAEDYKKIKDFANAIGMYKQALQLKPDDQPTLDLKKDAEKQLLDLSIEKLRKQKQKNYTDTISLADKAFQDKDFNQAKTFYQTASNIIPDEKYPIQKLIEIEKLIQKPLAEKLNVKTSNQTSEKNKVETDTNSPETQIKDMLAIIENEKKSGNNTEVLKGYANIASICQDNLQLDDALNYLNTALNTAKTIGDIKEEANIISQIATVYYDSGQYKQTILSYEQAIELKKQAGDIKGATATLSELGYALTNIYQYDKALDAYEEVMQLSQKVGNSDGVIDACDQIATIHYHQNNYKKSVQYYNKALAKAESKDDKQVVSSLKNSLGVVYYRMGNYDLAIKYYDQAIALDKETGNKKNLSLSFNNIGNVNFDWNKYDQAIEYYEKSLQLKRELNFEEGIAVSLFNIGSAYLELRDMAKAAEYLGSGLDLAKKIKFREVVQQTYKALSKVYELNNDFRNAIESYKSYSENVVPGIIVEGQFSETNNAYEKESKIVKRLRKELYRQKILAENEALQNKQKEQQLAVKELELTNQKSKVAKVRSLLLFTILILLLAAFVALQFYRRYKEKKLYSEVINFQKQQITDSIEYASRIQKAVLPPNDLVKSVFPESFIYNKPKDIVSGDYFYIAVVQEKTYVAVADCTGHGVPGAFMSMLGLSLIKEEILMQDKAPSADEVLNQLRNSLIKTLHQTGQEEEAKDGIDIALCVINTRNNMLEYSGANNPCYIVRHSKIIELKADRMPIGIHPILRNFNSQQLQLEKGDVIYLFSDGYRDQIGEETLKKFKKEYFNNLLINIQSLPLSQQADILDARHLQWRGNIDQTDDILVMGLKI